MNSPKCLYPSTVYNTEEHAKNCEYIAKYILNNKHYNTYIYKALVNYLFIRSDIAKDATAIIKIVSGKEKINEQVILNFETLKLLGIEARSLPTSLKIDFSGKIEYMSFKMLIIAFFKTFFNKIYRIGINNREIKKSVIRSWVDVNELMYRDKIDYSTILIYPFFLNLKRHYSFIKQCKKNRYNFVFMGVPYSFKKLFACFTSNKQERIIKYIEFEVEAYLAHANELIKKNIAEWNTSDEFEIASFVLGNEFRKEGITSINTSHGIGNYSPYISYDIFYTINAQQEQFYKKRSKYLLFRRRKNYINSEINHWDLWKKQESKYLVVYIHATMEKAGLKYEAEMQNNIINILKEVDLLKNSSIDLMIKFHPNLSNNKCRALEKRSGLKPFKDYSLLKEYNHKKILFVNIFSTLFYELKDKVDFIFVVDEHLDSSIFFGDEIKKINIDCLKSFITDWAQ